MIGTGGVDEWGLGLTVNGDQGVGQLGFDVLGGDVGGGLVRAGEALLAALRTLPVVNLQVHFGPVGTTRSIVTRQTRMIKYKNAYKLHSYSNFIIKLHGLPLNNAVKLIDIQMHSSSMNLHSHRVNSVGITTLFIRSPTGPKVIGQLAGQLFHSHV